MYVGSRDVSSWSPKACFPQQYTYVVRAVVVGVDVFGLHETFKFDFEQDELRLRKLARGLL